MEIKPATLEALNYLPRDRAYLAARRIVAHFHNGLEFGIEYLPLPGERQAVYVNTGETYDPTLVLYRGSWYVASWGDVLEEAEAEYAEDTGETLCHYCGEWSLGPCHG